MKTVEAIYEHGVLRPLEPLALAEGARVSVTFTEAATEKPSAPTREEGDATQRKMAEFLAEIAALPTEGKTDPFSGRDPEEKSRYKGGKIFAEKLAEIAAAAERHGIVETASVDHDQYLYGWERAE